MLKEACSRSSDIVCALPSPPDRSSKANASESLPTMGVEEKSGERCMGNTDGRGRPRTDTDENYVASVSIRGRPGPSVLLTASQGRRGDVVLFSEIRSQR